MGHDNRTQREHSLELAQLSAILEYSSDAIVSRTLDGMIASWSRGAERLLGYTAEEMVGQPAAKLIPPGLEHEAHDVLQCVADGQVVRGKITTRIHKDGSLVDISLDVIPITGAGDEIIGIMAVSHDISERVLAERAMQEANEALRRADELKNTFLRTVSHDVRSPLTAVLSAAKLLEDDSLTDEQRPQFARMVVRNAHRIRRLLDDVLDIERLTRGDGGLEPERELVNVGVMINMVNDELNPGGRTIEVECNAPTVWADRMQLERTIHNLVGNAIKHTGSEITVRTWNESDGTVIAVDDRGNGVPDELKEKIFEPFQRATDAHTPGTGVGLSLVAEFARAHGGRSWVEDRAGGGSSFRVFFPGEAQTEAA